MYPIDASGIIPIPVAMSTQPAVLFLPLNLPPPAEQAREKNGRIAEILSVEVGITVLLVESAVLFLCSHRANGKKRWTPAQQTAGVTVGVPARDGGVIP